MSKVDIKIIKLEEMFLSGRHLSKDDICRELDIKRSRVYYYLECMKKDGICLVTEIRSRKPYYYTTERENFISRYHPIDDKSFQKYQILYSLSLKPRIAQDLYNELTKSSAISMSLVSFYNLINEMIAEKLLVYSYIEEKNPDTLGRIYSRRYLYPSGVKNSLQIYINIDIEGQSLLYGYVSKNQLQGSALRSIQNKLALLSGEDTIDNFDESTFLTYGRGYHMETKIQDYYNELIQNKYREKVLSFKYREKPMKFCTGLVVYSQDKDSLYLIGRKLRTHNTSIVKCDEIEHLTYIDIANSEFGKSIYNDYLNDMFSISNESAEDVEIHFKDTENNYLQLERLCRLRTKARLSTGNGVLIYKDSIRGISDFSAYLRKFGDEYTVIKPESLKSIIHNSLTRLLDRYERKI